MTTTDLVEVIAALVDGRSTQPPAGGKGGAANGKGAAARAAGAIRSRGAGAGGRGASVRKSPIVTDCRYCNSSRCPNVKSNPVTKCIVCNPEVTLPEDISSGAARYIHNARRTKFQSGAKTMKDKTC
jgi:hypothetical protein